MRTRQSFLSPKLTIIYGKNKENDNLTIWKSGHFETVTNNPLHKNLNKNNFW